MLTVGWHWRTRWPAHCHCLSLVQPVTKLERQHQHTPEEDRHIHCQMGARTQGHFSDHLSCGAHDSSTMPKDPSGQLSESLGVCGGESDRLICSQISHYLHVMPQMRKSLGNTYCSGTGLSCHNYPLITRKYLKGSCAIYCCRHSSWKKPKYWGYTAQ